MLQDDPGFQLVYDQTPVVALRVRIDVIRNLLLDVPPIASPTSQLSANQVDALDVQLLIRGLPPQLVTRIPILYSDLDVPASASLLEGPPPASRHAGRISAKRRSSPATLLQGRRKALESRADDAARFVGSDVAMVSRPRPRDT